MNKPNFIYKEIEPKTLQKYIEDYSSYQQQYIKLYEYYVGDHDILNRVLPENKINNKTVNNFCNYITNTKTGYFLGVPVSVETEDDSYNTDLQEVIKYTDMADKDNKIAVATSIYGHCFELIYLDGEKYINNAVLNPTNTFGLYDGLVDEDLVAVVRFEKDEKESYFVEVFEADVVSVYRGRIDKLILEDEMQNFFGELQIVEYVNNDNKLGDCENILTLQDAYNLCVADNINLTNYFSEAYIVIKNMVATDQNDIKDMQNNRVISLPTDGDAYFLNKNVDNSQIEATLNRLKNDIHKFSNCPALDDESFAGNLSGVAMSYKLFGLETDTITKERKFTMSMMERYRLITKMINIKKATNYNSEEITLQFTRNIKQNLVEIVDTVTKLQNIVSQETLISLLPFVEDVSEELDKVNTEKENEFNNYDLNTIE